MNLPNKLTLLRVLMIPLFAWTLLQAPFGVQLSPIIADIIFMTASLTDMLDGYIARKHNLVTNFGKFMDPLADKLLVSAALIALTALGQLSGWVAIIIISRDIAVTGLRLLAAEKDIVIAAGFWGKLKTATQMIMIIVVILSGAVYVAPVIVQLLVLLSVAFAIISAVEYMVVNRQVFVG